MTITTKVLLTVLALGGCNGILDNPRPKLILAGGEAGAAGALANVAELQHSAGVGAGGSGLGFNGAGASQPRPQAGSESAAIAGSAAAPTAGEAPLAVGKPIQGIAAGGSSTAAAAVGGSATRDWGLGTRASLGDGPSSIGGATHDAPSGSTAGVVTLASDAAAAGGKVGQGDAMPGAAGRAGDEPRNCIILQHSYPAHTVAPADRCFICEPEQDVSNWVLRPNGVECEPGKVCADYVCKAGCWIDSKYFESGTPNPDNPCESCSPSALVASWSKVPTVRCVTAIAAGNRHSCASVGGKAYCWGDNLFGQLGNATVANRTELPVAVDTLGTKVTALTAGHRNSCAILKGSAYCWGTNSDVQLGIGSTEGGSFGPTQVKGLSVGVTTISAALRHICAVADGSVMCWGDNSLGQLGVDWGTNSAEPAPVKGLYNVASSVAAGFNPNSGESFGCAIFAGKLRCWGAGDAGQLGTGISQRTIEPIEVELGSELRAIALGASHGCAIVGSDVYCWGFNRTGALGVTPSSTISAPVRVESLTQPVSAITAGDSYTCVIQGGRVYCWGRCNNNEHREMPAEVPGLSDVTAISAGTHHTCAIAHGRAYCWGANDSGQLGNGSTAESATPVVVEFP